VTQILFALPLAFAMGVSLGLLGGGGSILAVPILVYLFGLGAKAAIATSLVIVGVTALFGALRHAGHGNLELGVGLNFGASGVLGALGASRLVAGGAIPETVLMGLFAILMVTVSTLMLRRKEPSGTGAGAANRPQRMRVAMAGLGTGILTGTLGVGGGFVIVPALVVVARLPMHRAIGTSLVVIALNCAAGLAGYVGRVTVSWDLAAVFALMGILGSVVGANLSARIRPDRLRRGFAVFVLALGAVILVDQLLALRP